jgi:cytochrome c553
LWSKAKKGNISEYLRKRLAPNIGITMNKWTQKIISLVCALLTAGFTYASSDLNKSRQASAGCMSCHQGGITSANNPKSKQKHAAIVSNKSTDAH